MKRNITIKTEVMDEYWNKDFLEKMKNGDLTASEEYCVETVSNMIEIALNKLRKEYSKKDRKVSQ